MFITMKQLLCLGDVSLDVMYIVKLGILTWKFIIFQHPVIEKS